VDGLARFLAPLLPAPRLLVLAGVPGLGAPSRRERESDRGPGRCIRGRGPRDRRAPGAGRDPAPLRAADALTRAYDHGYQWISVDFGTANPLSRPFWLNVGFQPAGYGVLRLIDSGARASPERTTICRRQLQTDHRGSVKTQGARRITRIGVTSRRSAKCGDEETHGPRPACPAAVGITTAPGALITAHRPADRYDSSQWKSGQCGDA
jgi:hypothetical protein